MGLTMSTGWRMNKLWTWRDTLPYFFRLRADARTSYSTWRCEQSDLMYLDGLRWAFIWFIRQEPFKTFKTFKTFVKEELNLRARNMITLRPAGIRKYKPYMSNYLQKIRKIIQNYSYSHRKSFWPKFVRLGSQTKYSLCCSETWSKL